MMTRTLIAAGAAICFAVAAPVQAQVSKKYDWDSNTSQTCMEPYAPAVPKAEETSIQELIEEVKPEVQAFIDSSEKYLDCLNIQIATAREDRDEAKVRKLVGAFNENVEYQKSVALEFNAALIKLKEEAGLALKQGSGAAEKGEKAPENKDAAAGGNAEDSKEKTAADASPKPEKDSKPQTAGTGAGETADPAETEEKKEATEEPES